jgi:hypothetical protein
MAMGSTYKLRIPKILAVSALGIVAGCPGDDQGDTGNESGPSPTTTAGTTMGEEPTTTAATETGADTSGGATETDTGALPDCTASADQTACEGVTSCAWWPEYGGCVLDCTIFEDMESCNANFHCEWTGETCDYAPLE